MSQNESLNWHVFVGYDESCENPRGCFDYMDTQLSTVPRFDEDEVARSRPDFWKWVVAKLNPTPGQLRHAGMKPRSWLACSSRERVWEDAEATVERWLDEQRLDSRFRYKEEAEAVLEALKIPYACTNLDRGELLVRFVEPSAWAHHYGWKRLTPARRLVLQKYIDAVDAEFNSWLEGDCHYFVAYRGREQESCGGYIGDSAHVRDEVYGYLSGATRDNVVFYDSAHTAETSALREALELARGATEGADATLDA